MPVFAKKVKSTRFYTDPFYEPESTIEIVDKEISKVSLSSSIPILPPHIITLYTYRTTSTRILKARVAGLTATNALYSVPGKPLTSYFSTY